MQLSLLVTLPAEEVLVTAATAVLADSLRLLDVKVVGVGVLVTGDRRRNCCFCLGPWVLRRIFGSRGGLQIGQTLLPPIAYVVWFQAAFPRYVSGKWRHQNHFAG